MLVTLPAWMDRPFHRVCCCLDRVAWNSRQRPCAPGVSTARSHTPIMAPTTPRLVMCASQAV